MHQKIFSDIPESVGVENALKRARQLAGLKWTPIRPFPTKFKDVADGQKRFHSMFLPAWRPQTGVNYSAARFDEKYVGFNVSPETYLTAMSNPDSVLYHRFLFDRAPLSSAYYGTVCSEFVSYVMDLPFHIDCPQWAVLDGISSVDSHPLENLKLCDILLERKTHIAIITGIRRYEDGSICDIAVTESTLPKIETKVFRPAEFVEYWLNNGYEVLRYGKLDRVTYHPDPWAPLDGEENADVPVPNPVLMPDYGNKANYMLGETVTVSVFDPSYMNLVVLHESGASSSYSVVEGKVSFVPEQPGFYSVYAVSAAGKSLSVEFCVTASGVALEKEEFRESEAIVPEFSCPAEDSLVGWVVKTDGFAKYWCYPMDESGVIPKSAMLPAGNWLVISMHKNCFGVYSSKPCFFRVVP